MKTKKFQDRSTLSLARLAGLGGALFAVVLLFLIVPVVRADSITVTTEDDDLDTNKGTCVGLAYSNLPGPDGEVSLREAICAANTSPGADTITLGEGAFRLFRLGADDTAQDGDLDILASGGDLTIQGAGPTTSTIYALGCVGGADRVFHVDPAGTGGITVNFVGVTIRKGCTTEGGGLRLEGENTVNMTDCVVTENQVVGDYSIGGGILLVDGALNLSATNVLTNYGSGSYVDSQTIGGGIFAASGTHLNLKHSGVGYNQISAQGLSLGAGIYAQGSQVMIELTEVALNSVNGNDARGGGIAARMGSTITISGSFFTYNSADVLGGAIYNDGSSFKISNSAILMNEAVGAGGGISASGGSIKVTDSMLGDNSTDGEGGGALNDNGTLEVTRTIVFGNDAQRHGGGIMNKHSGTLTVTNSTFYDNKTFLSGGGISTDRGDVAITNSTFSANKADEHGGGLYHWAETTDLNFTTFHRNVADEDGDGTGDGGGIYVTYDTLNLNNSIVAGNTDRGGQAPDCGGPIDTHGDNIIQDDFGCTLGGSGTNQTGVDPKLDILRDNGGGGLLLTHALLKGSPALDAVTTCNDLEGSPVTVDERGVTRPKFSACDIGAYEWAGYPVYLPMVLR